MRGEDDDGGLFAVGEPFVAVFGDDGDEAGGGGSRGGRGGSSSRGGGGRRIYRSGLGPGSFGPGSESESESRLDIQHSIRRQHYMLSNFHL